MRQREAGFYEFKPMYVTKLPIPAANEDQKTTITSIVQTILADPDSPNVPSLEAEINRLVYDLYGLTGEEIGLVEKTG